MAGTVLKVLVAEDDATSRAMLRAMIEKWGYEVVVVADGRAAWEALGRPGAPRLALLDWMMPGLDGVEVCRRVRAMNSSEPAYLILLTARGGKSDIVAGLEAGADDYISKPYNSEELQARLGVGRRVLELRDNLERALDEARRLARTDPLTGIPNRRAILELLQAEMARAHRDGTSLWVSMLDIDHFKAINDSHGHAAGDQVLRECARRIVGVIRLYDAVGRFGGEEFLILIPTKSEPHNGDIFERIRAVLAGREFPADGASVTVTASQGVTLWDGVETVDDLIRRADEALYRAKARGRNRIEYTAPPDAT